MLGFITKDMATRLLHRFYSNSVKCARWTSHSKNTTYLKHQKLGLTGLTLWQGLSLCYDVSAERCISLGPDLSGSSRWYHSLSRISGCPAITKTAHHHNRNVDTRVTTFSTSAEPTKLIYNGPLTTVVKGVKFFSLSTTIMSGALVPLLLTYGDSGIMTTIGLSFATMMIATPIILHWFSRSYITKMYFDKIEDVYIAKTVTFILREATHKFKAADVAIPPVRNVFTTFVANGRPFMVDPRGFFNPNHFSQLMGQDQISQEELEKMIKSMKDDED